MAEYYHRLGVRYRKPHYVYSYKDRHQREVFERQQEVSRELVDLMMQEESELIFIDEATFNMWQTASRCWLRRDMALTLPDKRSPSFTVIGAISARRGLIYYKIKEGSNDSNNFAAFISNLK